MEKKKHKLKEHQKLFYLSLLVIVVSAAIVFTGVARLENNVRPIAPEVEEEEVMVEEEVVASELQTSVTIAEHQAVPDEVRGLYWTAYTAGTSRKDALLDYMETSGINTVVVDLKMDDGAIAFVPHNEDFLPYALDNPVIDDLEGLLEELKDRGLYRIARIPVMRDGAFATVHPEYAMQNSWGGYWYDDIGSLWIDPAGAQVAEYAVALGREAYARGFDEIQYDYVRFASDGAISAISYPIYDHTREKYEVMYDFFKTVGGTMQAEGIPVSFDTFGITCWSGDDFNIGQRLVDVLPFADYVSPMVYPSHFPDGFKGYGNPALYPYDIVKRSMDECVNLASGFYKGSIEELQVKMRPWIQDFDIGAVYTADLIEAQIEGARDAGSSGWILWNARNVYEPANYWPPEETEEE